MINQITNVNDIYSFVDRLKTEAERAGAIDLFQQLDDAMHLGSSGLEILGGIRQVLVTNKDLIAKLPTQTLKDESNQVVIFVNKTFGQGTAPGTVPPPTPIP